MPSYSKLDAWSAVFTVLGRYRLGALISTHTAIADTRARLPAGTIVSDEELLNLIVKAATANGMVISFDHRAQAGLRAQEKPATT